MILYPAIDLKEGRCVRLVRGEMDQATVFNDDPAAQARAFADAGCAWLHVVDLDGAFAGRPENATAVEGILAATPGEMRTGIARLLDDPALRRSMGRAGHQDVVERWSVAAWSPRVVAHYEQLLSGART